MHTVQQHKSTLTNLKEMNFCNFNMLHSAAWSPLQLYACVDELIIAMALEWSSIL